MIFLSKAINLIGFALFNYCLFLFLLAFYEEAQSRLVSIFFKDIEPKIKTIGYTLTKSSLVASLENVSSEKTLHALSFASILTYAKVETGFTLYVLFIFIVLLIILGRIFFKIYKIKKIIKPFNRHHELEILFKNAQSNLEIIKAMLLMFKYGGQTLSLSDLIYVYLHHLYITAKEIKTSKDIEDFLGAIETM